MRRETVFCHDCVRVAVSISRFAAAFLLLVGCATKTVGQPPPGYYVTVDTSSATTLRATVHAVIDDHTRFPYTDNRTPTPTNPHLDTWDILDEASEDPSDSNNILDVYRNASLTKQGGGTNFYQREHTWPKSYGFPDNVVTNYPYTDCPRPPRTDRPESNVLSVGGERAQVARSL